jgi:hypothetical protein
MNTKNITPLRKGEMEVGRMYNIDNTIEIKGKFAKGGIVSKIKGYYDGGPVYNPNMNIDGTYGDSNSSYKPIDTFGSGVVGQNDQYTAQNNMQAKKAIDENKKKANQQKARNVANGIGEGMGGIGSAYYNSQPAQNEGESARNAGMAAVSQMGGIGGMIGGIAAIGDKIGKPIKARKESMNAEGKLNNESDARTTAIGASFLSPSKALATRSSYAGGWTDVSGKGYTKSLEDKAQKQLQEVKDANTASKQQQAILARNNQEENPTITNPYNLTGVTFDENQNMILADGQQFDKNRPMMNRGGVVGKIKNMYADGGDIKGKGTAKSDSIMAEVKEGSFVVPAENAELAKGIRKLYLKAPNKKANLKQEEGEAVKLSNGEHLFTPEENEYLESIGIELEDLAPNSENNSEEMKMGGMLKRADGSYSKRGLWDNIRDAAGSNKAPTADMLKQEKKIKAEYAKGGYVVQRSGDREGKTHKVTGPDGTVKYFGDPNLGQHPKDPARKEAFYARHKENLDNNPHFRAYARETWAEGGTVGTMNDRTYIGEYKDGGLTKSKAKIMLHEGMANGKPITEQQRKYFGLVAGGSKQSKMDDGEVKGYAEGGPVKGTKVDGATWDGKNWVSADGSKYSTEGGKKFTDKYNQSVAKEKSNQEQKTASEINLYSRKLKEATDNGNTEEAKRLQAKINELSGTKKTETKPSVVTENIPTAKPSLKAPKVTPKTEAGKFIPTLTPDTGEEVVVPGSSLSPNEIAKIKADEDKAVAQATALNSSLPQTLPTTSAPVKSKNAWANKLSNIDPTAFVGIGQSALGLNMLGKEKRPIDKAVIDPTYNAAVNRAQQDALFGLTPEQRFMAEQDIQGGLNDAKFAGLNSSASDSFNRNRAAINDAWKNKLGLKQADAEMRMNKQKYADVMAADRATILAANRRQAYNDAMNTFQQKQKAGSELIGAGLMNTIDAYRFKRSMEQRDAAEKQKTDFVNKI